MEFLKTKLKMFYCDWRKILVWKQCVCHVQLQSGHGMAIGRGVLEVLTYSSEEGSWDREKIKGEGLLSGIKDTDLFELWKKQ